MADHDIELVHPFYGSKDGHTAFCTCGWNSEEQPTAGKATIAGWKHINSAPRDREVAAYEREHRG